jgi:MFS family permease
MCSVGLPAISALIILFFPDVFPMVVVAVVLLGLSVGGEYDAIIYLSTRHFGLRNFGTLFGFVTSLILAGVGLGPILGAVLYDIGGDYRLFLWLAIPMSLTTSVLLGTLGRYPDHEIP